MSFRRMYMCLATAWLAGCGLRTGEKAPGPMVVRLASSRYSCVSQVAPTVQKYFDAQMDDSEIESYVSCLQNAFQLFNQTFHGATDWNSFSPDEIRAFLENNFLPEDRKISDELLNQFMIVKQDLLGGDRNRITRSDLTAAIQTLEQIKQEAIRLRPHIPVLNSTLVEAADPATLGDKILAADAATNATIKVIGGLLARSQKPYRFDDFQSFLTEFRKFARWDEHFADVRPETNWKNLLVAFKTATVSPGETEIQPSDWVPLLQSAVGWYLNYLRFDVGVRNQPLLEGNGFKNFVSWGDGVQNLLSVAVERQQDHVITYDTMTRLVSGLEGVGWLPNGLRPESVESSLHALIDKVFGPKGPTNQGLTKATLANVAVEWSQWKDVQRALQKHFSQSENRITRVRADSDKIPLLALPIPISASVDQNGWDQFFADFDQYRPLFKEDLDRVFLVEEQLLPSLNVTNGFYNLSLMNLFRTGLDLIFKGYAPDAADYRQKGIPMAAGLPKAGLESFYQDFRQLGIDLGFVDRRIDSAGSRTYMEAKIFTYLADGLDGDHSLLTYAQGVQEEAFLVSGGELSRDLYKRLANYCRPGSLDLDGLAKLDRNCVRGHTVSELLDLITTMPGYTNYLRALDEPKRLVYVDTLMNAAKRDFSSPDEIELSELATMAMVIHYSEAIMTRYNENLDDRLSEAEINQAVPIFRGLIQALAAKLGIWSPAPDNTFKFILANGRLPSGYEDFEEIGRHAALDTAGFHESWGLSLDRTGITRVFASIIGGMMDPKR